MEKVLSPKQGRVPLIGRAGRRFRLPSDVLIPRLGMVLVMCLATVLIGIIVRSPDTKSNLRPGMDPNYHRTVVTTIGSNVSFGISRENTKGQIPQGDINPAMKTYISNGCASCHGVDVYLGGVVGAALAGADPNIVKKMVRGGPEGMPSYGKALSDADLDELASYLNGLRATQLSSEELSVLRSLSYDASIPKSTLLKGKDTIRKSCGQCHSPPGKEELLGGFQVGDVLSEMVPRAKLPLEEAKAVAYYIFAIRNGADPINMP